MVSSRLLELCTVSSRFLEMLTVSSKFFKLLTVSSRFLELLTVSSRFQGTQDWFYAPTGLLGSTCPVLFYLQHPKTSPLTHLPSSQTCSPVLSESIFDEENKLVPEAKPYTTDSAVLKKNHPLMVMVRNDQEDLLAHPLVGSLLRHKWRSFGRYVYYTNLFIYVVFLVFLTGYVCTTEAPYQYENKYGL